MTMRMGMVVVSAMIWIWIWRMITITKDERYYDKVSFRVPPSQKVKEVSEN